MDIGGAMEVIVPSSALQSITKEAVRMGLDLTGNQRNKKIVKLKTSFNLKSCSNRIAVQSPVALNASPEHEGLRRAIFRSTISSIANFIGGHQI